MPLSPPGPTSLNAAGAFLKHVPVPAACKGKPVEVSRPNSVCSPAAEASRSEQVAGLFSQRWDWGTLI